MKPLKKESVLTVVVKLLKEKVNTEFYLDAVIIRIADL